MNSLMVPPGGAPVRQIVPAPQGWPTAFASALRTCIYQPTTSPRPCTRTVQGTYGIATVKGCAGQCEAALHDALMYANREPTHPDDAGAIRHQALHPESQPLPGTPLYQTSTGNPFLIAEVEQCRRLLARRDGERGPAVSRSLDRLLDLNVTLSTNKTRDGHELTARGHLLDTVLTIHEGGRAYLLALLGPFDIALLGGDVLRFFDPRCISQMRTGVAQAAARFLLAQDASRWPCGGYKLDTILRSVGVQPGGATRKARLAARADAEAFRTLGFEIDGDDRVHIARRDQLRAGWWHRRHSAIATGEAWQPGPWTPESLPF